MLLKSVKKQNNEIKIKSDKKIKFNSKREIFNITLTGLFLALAVGSSLPPVFEWPIKLMDVNFPLRIFDSLIMAFAIPIIGLGYTLAIAIFEPWLHLLLDSDHAPIQILFDNVTNILFVISFYFIYYFMFKLRDQDQNGKKYIFKKISACGILIPFNALISTLAFVLTLLVIYFYPHLKGNGEYEDNITNFNKNTLIIFLVLFCIEMLRFMLIYVLFSLVEKKMTNIKSRYY